MADENEPSLQLPATGGTNRDVGAAFVKGIVGAIPGAGPLLAEIIGLVIPNQRLQRIETYLRLLGDRLDRQDEKIIRARLSEPAVIDLFEDGAIQAARALSEERKSYIATLVFHGISGDDKARIEAKRLLALLAELDDDQVIILASYLIKNRNDQAFHDRHKNILQSVRAHIGADREIIDASTVQELARAQLMRFGLLRSQFDRPRKGEVPEFDPQSGMMKERTRELSSLGRLLLVRMGLANPEEY